MAKKRFLPQDISLTHKQIARLCATLLALSLLPLYGISFFNHPYYDDFGFSILTHAAWRDTGNAGAVIMAAWRNTVGIRQTWQGMYTPSFLSALQPGLFGEGYYWIATFLLLSGLLASTLFFVWQILYKVLGAGRAATLAAWCCLAFLLVQFTPAPDEAFYWYNGGVGYTLMWCLLLLSSAVWLLFHRLDSRAGRGKRAALYLLLLLLLALSGGAGYSLLLFYSAGFLLFTSYAFVRKHPRKWAHLFALLLFLGCFAFNMAAPGNAVRAKTLHGGLSIPMAIAQSLYFGFALIGHWFTLPIAALLILLAALLFPTLRASRFSFARPGWITLLCGCLFCTQLTATLFTGNYLGDGRVFNIYYDTYVLMMGFLALYWTGWVQRKGWSGFSRATSAPALDHSVRIKGSVLAAAALLLLWGIVSYRPDGAESYGPQNMTSGSAALSMLRGEAAGYDRQMRERHALLNDAARPEVVLSPATGIPKVFVRDILRGGSREYVCYLYAEYYNKASVTVAEDALKE